VQLRQPADGHDATREQFFGCPVVRGAVRDGIAFAAAECDTQLVGQEAELARESDVAADRFMHALAARPVATGVRRVLLDLLPSGDVTLEQVAVRMKRSLSTLQRQLQQEGATYREVLDDTRRLMAEGYLSNPRLPLSEVAYLLGFEDQSSFSRAFRRWTGSSPRRYREQAALGPPAGAGH
jgi:AraC-like DNA-binding protein